MKYKYRVGRTEGEVEAVEYEEAMAKVMGEIGLEIDLITNEEGEILDLYNTYINHSATFIDVITDWEKENLRKDADTLASILRREYRIYLLDELNTEHNDITKIKNYLKWEELELDRLLENSGTDITGFSLWVREEYV